MPKYKVIRKCHYLSRRWTEGDIVELTGTPPHHFKLLDDVEDIKVTVSSNRPVDPFKMKEPKPVNSFYEAQNSIQTMSGGFANNIGGKPITRQRDLKIAKEPEPSTDYVKNNKKAK